MIAPTPPPTEPPIIAERFEGDAEELEAFELEEGNRPVEEADEEIEDEEEEAELD